MHPWKRFWRPEGVEISCGYSGEGFFDDPEQGGLGTYNKKCKTLPELLENHPVLILCGPPGSGKSTELEEVSKGLAHSKAVEVIFRAATAFGTGHLLPDLSVRSKEWQRALAAGKRILFFVDGIDEALQREQTLLSSLIELLKAEPLDQVTLIISCRSALWQSDTGEGLARLWGREETDFVYEICPLRLSDVSQAVDNELPGRREAFFQEIDRSEVQPLARWPITLNMLIEAFRLDSSLPSSRAKLYRSAIDRLVEEWNERRETNLRSISPDWIPGEKVQLARRIAAQMIFGAKKALVRLDQNLDPDCLSYSEILGDQSSEEVSPGVSFPITRQKLDRLSETRLFESAGSTDSRGASAVKFSHRTLAELLAGEYVAGLGSEELRRLFFVRQGSGEELIVPQLLQTAAWLAGSPKGDHFFDLMLSLHPEAFLLADLAPFGDDQKSTIILRLLEKASGGDPGPDRAVSKASHSLKFPGIEKLLKSAILDEKANLHARRFALNLARTCRISELSEAVWSILDRPDDPMTLEAAQTLRYVEEEPESNRDRLLKLASGETHADGSDTLKGVALDLLVPRCVPVREVLGLLTPPQIESYCGTYHMFLTHKLPKAVTGEDISSCLDFLRSKHWCFDTSSPYGNFATRVFELACENQSSSAISDRLVLLLLDKARNFQPLPRGAERHGDEVYFGSQENAEDFIESFLNHPEVTSDDVDLKIGRISGLSLAFLLQRLPFAPPERRALWAKAIRYLARTEDRAENRELLQRRYDEYEELRNVFPPIRKPGHDLHDTLHRFERAGELILARHRKKNEARLRRIRKEHLTWEEVFRTGVAQCCSGEARGWINVVYGAHGDSDSQEWANSGVLGSELFMKLTEHERESVRTCARRFLVEFDDERGEEDNRTNWSEAANEAVKCFRNEIADDPLLRKAVSEKWIGAIIDSFNNGEDTHLEMVRLAYEFNPTEAKRWMRKLLDRQLHEDGEGWLSVLRSFENAWDRTLSIELADFLAGSKVKPRSMREGLHHLLEFDAVFGAELVTDKLDAIRRDDPTLGNSVSRAVVGVAWFFAAEAEMESAWPLIAGNAQSARALFLEISRDLDWRELKFLDRISASRIADLLLLFFSLFPPKDDPPMRHEMTFVTSLDECIQLRSGLIRALTKRGEIEELRRFLRSLPSNEADLYKWNLEEAKQNRAMQEWIPACPGELLRLVRISNGSLIRNADDLLEVVLASLSRFQDDLQQHNLHRVWDGDSPKREEFVSKELTSWLKNDLKNIAVNREVEVNRWNERVDIKIEAFTKNEKHSIPFTVIIEVKRAHNGEIPESINTQLVEKYLLPNPGWTHGIYLVAWFYSRGKWEGRQYLSSKSPKGAETELQGHCEAAGKSRGLRIEPFLLDCSSSPRVKARKPKGIRQ